MSGVVVIGNGGHARACIDAWAVASDSQPVGCTGLDPTEASELPYLGGDDALPDLYARGLRQVFVALGNSRLREVRMREAVELGFSVCALISDSAQVARTATVGGGAAVLRGAIVGAYARIGEGAIINTGASVDHDCRVGPFAHIAPGTHLAGNVTIGAHSMLGVGVSVVPGVTIGARVTVGAGAVVISDVPEGQTVVGVPARPHYRKA